MYAFSNRQRGGNPMGCEKAVLGSMFIPWCFFLKGTEFQNNGRIDPLKWLSAHLEKDICHVS